MIEPAMVKIVGGHPRGDRDQPRRMFSSSEELRSSLVRKAVHADFAIAGWMLNQPRECVETVGRFVAKRIKCPFGVASSTNILDDHVIAGSSKPDWVRIDDGRRNVAPIRLPHEKRRGRSGSGGGGKKTEGGFNDTHATRNVGCPSVAVCTKGKQFLRIHI